MRGDEDDPDQHSYSPRQVARLLGFEEGIGDADERDVTILDILSWAHDPGGDYSPYFIALNTDPDHAWMARRGPLSPFSDAASTLFDFLMAVNRLPLFQKAVVALHLGGLGQDEIATLLHTSQSVVSRILHGRPKRDARGNAVRDDQGLTVHTGGIQFRIATLMNGGPR